MQYDKALSAQRNNEENEYFRTLNPIWNFHIGHPIKRYAGEVYTKAVFNIFQAEFQESDSMLAKRIQDRSDHVKYMICNQVVEKMERRSLHALLRILREMVWCAAIYWKN